jgi:cytidyltransferase-like protein
MAPSGLVTANETRDRGSGHEVSLAACWRVRPDSAATPVVVTGVFDVLHVGHLRFLQDAAESGHPLVVGVEDDARVRAWKGASRPINPASERAELLAGLRVVAGVFVVRGSSEAVEWQHYVPLLHPLHPHALAYTEGDPFTEVKRLAAAELGAEPREVSLVPGHSSTDVLAHTER